MTKDYSRLIVFSIFNTLQSASWLVEYWIVTDQIVTWNISDRLADPFLQDIKNTFEITNIIMVIQNTRNTSIGPIHEIMDVLHVMKKGKMVDTLEKVSYLFRNNIRMTN